jgi:hypothetical protein
MGQATMSNWQSIDLAPRDGRTITGRAQVASGFQYVFIRWDKAVQHGSMQTVGRNTRRTIH